MFNTNSVDFLAHRCSVGRFVRRRGTAPPRLPPSRLGLLCKWNWYRSKWAPAFLAAIIYLIVVFVNPGFMGTDEYWTGITRYIPAQTSALESMVGDDDVKSPAQILPMYITAQLALKLGIEPPFSQYQFVVFILGFFSFLILAGSFAGWADELSLAEGRILWFLLGFYFAAPFVFSRPMFESLAAPGMSWAALLAYRYDQQQKIKYLLLGILAISLAFVLRPQTGLCALVFIGLPLLHRQSRHLIIGASAGFFLLLLTGLPDLWLRGAWHFSLRALAEYNFQHGHEYGQQPWTFYPVMLLALSWAPLLAHRVEKVWLYDYLKKYRTLLIMSGLFVFLHSLFSQKFERFLIPLLPLILVLLAPWLHSLYTHHHRKRLWGFWGANIFLWTIASFQPAQNNIIEMARYLDSHPEIKSIYRLEKVPEWIPDVFVSHREFHFEDIPAQALGTLSPRCQDRIILTRDMSQQVADLPWVEETQFRVNFLEEWSYRLNKKNNLRRAELVLWRPKSCPSR